MVVGGTSMQTSMGWRKQLDAQAQSSLRLQPAVPSVVPGVAGWPFRRQRRTRQVGLDSCSGQPRQLSRRLTASVPARRSHCAAVPCTAPRRPQRRFLHHTPPHGRSQHCGRQLAAAAHRHVVTAALEAAQLDRVGPKQQQQAQQHQRQQQHHNHQLASPRLPYVSDLNGDVPPARCGS